MIEYAAGFFDGEGCVNCSSGRKNSPFIRILVVNTNLEVLKVFQNFWGGDINKNYKPKEHWKQAYTWRLSHKSALKFLSDILPYLIVKKEQAELAIKFGSIRPGKGNKWSENSLLEANDIINAIKEKNKKGIEIT